MEKKAHSPATSLSISMKNLSRPSIRGKPTSPLSSSRALSNTSLGTLCYGNRVDLKTYTDVRSNGLTTRVAKYGGPVEDRPRKNLSKSPFALASRKPELKNTPTRSSSLSIGRIAPPERVVFSPKSRSNILRSNSVVSLPSLSRREDEPLAPTSDIEETPTPSVLDVLQEISRKRINNEELDAERIKKQCKEITDVDGPVKSYTGVLKRSNTSPNESEQKKQRTCRNNEIFSSLSSTQPMPAMKRSASESPKGVDVSTKIAHIERDTQQNRPMVIKETAVELAKAAAEPILVVHVPIIHKPAPKLTLFNRKYDETPLNTVNAFEEEKPEINFVKPQKEVTTNREIVRKVEQNKLKVLLSCLSGELDEDDTVDAKEPVSAAAPVATSASTLPIPAVVVPASKPAVTTTTSSAPTVITSPQAQKSIFTITSTAVSLPTVTDTKLTLSTSTPSTFTPIKSTLVSTPISTAEPVKPAITFETKTPAEVSTGKVTFGDVKKPEPALKGFGTNAPISFGVTSTAATPIAFGNTSTASTTPAISFAPTTATTAVPTFGLNTTPATSSFAFGTNSTSTAGIPALGNNNKNCMVTVAPPTFGNFASNTTVATSTPAPPAFGTQSVFGTPATTTSASSGLSDKPVFGMPVVSTAAPVTSTNQGSFFGATSAATPAVAAPSSVANQPSSIFGLPASSPSSSTAFGISTTTATDKPASIFGTPQPASNSSSIFGQQNPTNSTTEKPAGIFGSSNFGQNTLTSKPSTTFGTSTDKPIFGSADKSAFSVPEKSTQSVFGQSTQQAQPPPAFGSTSTSSVFGGSSAFGGASENKSSIFGNNAGTTFNPSVVNSSATPAFGASTTTPPTFGSNSTTSAGAFGSGSTTSPFGGSQTGTSTFGSATSGGVFGSSNATPRTPAFNSTFGSSNDAAGGFNFKLPSASANTEKSIFSRLGARVETPNSTTASKDLFAFSSNNTSSSNFSSPAPPAFGNTFASPSPPAFGQTAAKPETPAFNFNSSASASSGGEQPFMFGGSAQAAAPSFNFSAGSNINNNNNNNNGNSAFGFGASNPAPAPAFNFNAPAPVGAPAFAVGTGNAPASTAGQRRIRTAVRRR